MEKNKIITYVGFALRARKIKCGVNAVKTIKGKAYALIVCKSASKNTFEEAIDLAKKLSATLVISNEFLLEDVVCKPNCKLVAVTDESLGKAILDNLGGSFTAYSGGCDIK